MSIFFELVTNEINKYKVKQVIIIMKYKKTIHKSKNLPKQPLMNHQNSSYLINNLKKALVKLN